MKLLDAMPDNFFFSWWALTQQWQDSFWSLSSLAQCLKIIYNMSHLKVEMTLVDSNVDFWLSKKFKYISEKKKTLIRLARKWYFFGDFQTLWNDVVHSVVSHEFFPCLIESRILGNYPIYAHWGWLPTFCILIACRVKIENRCRYSKQPLIRDFFFRSSAAVGIGGSSSRSSVWALSVRHIKDNMRFSFSTFTFELLLLFSLS